MERRPVASLHSLPALATAIGECRLCPRLVAWREEVARTRRKAYRDEAYWGRGVPGWGDPEARLVVVGLAPGAHGANRTGRMFTGDGSGDFLFAALHRAGFASQPGSVRPGDGLTLRDCWITAAARCAPPGNRVEPAELARCAPFLDQELVLLPRARVLLCLGAVAWDAVRRHGERVEGAAGRSSFPKFAHGAEHHDGSRALVASYHVSRQNTQTGRLTAASFDSVLGRVRSLLTP